jgi:hypothetical protein
MKLPIIRIVVFWFYFTADFIFSQWFILSNDILFFAVRKADCKIVLQLCEKRDIILTTIETINTAMRIILPV